MRLFKIINNTIDFGVEPATIGEQELICSTDRANVLTWAALLSGAKGEPYCAAGDKAFIVAEFSFDEAEVYATRSAENRWGIQWDIHQGEIITPDELIPSGVIGAVEYDLDCTYMPSEIEVKSFYAIDPAIVEKALSVIDFNVNFRDFYKEGHLAEAIAEARKRKYGALEKFGDVLSPISQDEAKRLFTQVKADRA